MAITRREFLLAGGAIAGMSVMGSGIVLGAATTAPASMPASPSARGAAFRKRIGEAQWNELQTRVKKTNADIQARGLRNFRNYPEKLLTGYPYNEYYDWDLYFENVYLSYFGVWPYCFSNLRLFLDRQEADGYVNRSLIKKRDRQHFKPFLAQLVVLGTRQNSDHYEWVRGNYYERLKKYLNKWFSYDGDQNGLPAWNSADAAGTDNQWSRAGALAAFEFEGVDLASYLLRELQAMAVIAQQLGEDQDHQDFLDRAKRLSALMNEVFWDESQGMYFDRNEKTNKRVLVKSATNFMPLFCGAATPERAKRMVNEHLLNVKEFWLQYPVASYARTEPDYYQGSHNECNWRGPTWAPTNCMIFHGLVSYGFNDAAETLASRLFEMTLSKNPVLREYYNAETGEGLGQTKFWGFTALYYGMLLEYELNYDATALTGKSQAIMRDELGLAFDA